MLAGKGNAVLPPERATVAPPEGAAPESVTVTSAVPPPATVEGFTVTDVRAAGAALISDQSVASA